MYYLLGWRVGDFGKNYGNERRLSARFTFQLTKSIQRILLLENMSLVCHDVGYMVQALRRQADFKSNPNGYSAPSEDGLDDWRTKEVPPFGS